MDYPSKKTTKKTPVHYESERLGFIRIQLHFSTVKGNTIADIFVLCKFEFPNT